MSVKHQAESPLEERLASKVRERGEEEQIEQRSPIGAHIIYEAIRREGDDELSRSSAALAWSGLAAGLSMGFSLLAEALLAAHLPQAGWQPLVSKLGYSMGFLIVILGKQQLFTENTLTVILPLLLRKNASTALNVLRLWGVVLLSNLAGTYIFSLCFARIALFDSHIQRMLFEVSRERLDAPFHIVLVRSIFAGWLIALMVWLLPSAEAARVSVIIIVTWLIGIGGFNHIIAGSNKMFFLVASGAESWGWYFVRFFLPTLLGNIIGGVSLVAFLSHAQVVAGEKGGL
ncbi:MAG TPA: formate/nitrite transporter family protein [Candidatus Acidoferrales bacterium]|nr:formate/nitrite transporter family protein [Candidatus Acidoferrales bacterium]